MTVNDLLANTIVILPLVVLMAWACMLLLVDLAIPKGRKGWTAVLAAIGLLIAMGLAFFRLGRSEQAFGGMVSVDGFGLFLSILFPDQRSGCHGDCS